MPENEINAIGADKFIDKLNERTQKLHAEQRYTRGFSDIDMWNLDGFIADVIVAGCDWMLANGANYPSKRKPDEWLLILQSIRDGFASRNEFDVPDPPKATWRLLRKNFKNLWD